MRKHSAAKMKKQGGAQEVRAGGKARWAMNYTEDGEVGARAQDERRWREACGRKAGFR